MSQYIENCWCVLCQTEHRVFFHKQWFVHGCPHFLNLNKLEENNQRFNGFYKRKFNKPQYKNKNNKNKQRNKNQLTSILRQQQSLKKASKKPKPKTHWHIDIEDISTGEL